MADFSDYIVYVDESGDHGLISIDKNYPVFVLALCIFRKDVYMDQLVPAVQKFKFQHFGHDQIILHESDIRKDKADFSFLKGKALKNAFLEKLTQIIDDVPFTLIASVIQKEKYTVRYRDSPNPYHVALGFGLERVCYYLRSQGADTKKTHIIVEKRGIKEDNDLELEFRRICDGANYEKANLPFEIIFSDKKSNSTGLQIADLVARPIGRRILNSTQDNRAYDILEKKFYKSRTGNKRGWGLKCYP